MPYKITVLKKMENPELAEAYCYAGGSVCPCPAFQVGQEFITEYDRPANFCEWAWDDIYKYIVMFRSGGNMHDTFKWMNARDTMIACCSDGIRPVVFKIEKME
ncbi:MAG TPA: TIGR04076 family protein [Aggregatilineaceae bacterium]|nr:TIGR04076 family protein [Aggregatilineaceae bacterium]